MTALELAEKIKQRQISVLDGVKTVFAAIEKKENRIHAYLDIYKKEAYARARQVEKGIAEGIYTGPLAGVPIAVKDNICVKGKKNHLRFQNAGKFCAVLSGGGGQPSGTGGNDSDRKNKYG